MGLGPFDLPGPAFLMLYAGFGVLAMLASLMVPPWLRPDGRPGAPADADELAQLAGGINRFAEAVTMRLMAAGAVTVEAGRGLRIRDVNGGNTLAERRVIALGAFAPWTDVIQSLKGLSETTERRLEQRGLLLDAVTAHQLRLVQTAPLALLFVFGAIKVAVGVARDRQVGFLLALMFVTIILAIWRYAVLDRRTRAGNAALAEARAGAQRLRRAAPRDEAPTAVALFGTAVLAGSFLSDFHRMRRKANSDGGSADGSSSGGDGGGGCGGGGCGGCS